MGLTFPYVLYRPPVYALCCEFYDYTAYFKEKHSDSNWSKATVTAVVLDVQVGDRIVFSLAALDLTQNSSPVCCPVIITLN